MIFNEVLLKWEVPAVPIEEIQGTYEVGIVLGGTADTERAPFDRLYFSKGAERITQAVTLYKAGKIRKILFTGGNAELFEDPEKDNTPIFQYYLSCGVDPDDIIIENRSRNTHENAVLTKEMLVENNLLDQKHVLLTSAFHMRRAAACYRKEGIDVLEFSTDFYTALPDNRYDFSQFLPSAPVLGNWEFLIKEFVGYIAYWLADYI